MVFIILRDCPRTHVDGRVKYSTPIIMAVRSRVRLKDAKREKRSWRVLQNILYCFSLRSDSHSAVFQYAFGAHLLVTL